MMQERSSSQANEVNTKLALQGKVSGAPDAYFNNVTGGFYTIDEANRYMNSLTEQIKDLKLKRFKTAGAILGFGGSACGGFYFLPHPYNVVAMIIIGVITLATAGINFWASPESESIKRTKDILKTYDFLLDKNLKANQHTTEKEAEYNRTFTDANINLQKTVLNKNIEKAHGEMSMDLMDSKGKVAEAVKNLDRELTGVKPIQNLDVLNREVSKQLANVRN